MPQPVIVQSFPDSIIHLALHAESVLASTLIEKGDLLRYESAGLGIFDTAADDVIFVGIAMGKTTTSMVVADTIPVLMKGTLRIDLTSASYDLGEGLLYTSKNTLVTDAAANTIAHYYDIDSGTITSGKVLVDIVNLNKLFLASA